MDSTINIQAENNNNISKDITNEKEIPVENNNIIVKKDEAFIDTENNIDNEEDDHKAEFDIEKIDIQIEHNKTNENDEAFIQNNFLNLI